MKTIPKIDFEVTQSLFVVSAPSGTGKTTLNRRLMRDHSDIVMATSHTTRPMRSGEKEAYDYYFLDIPSFEAMINKGELLEYAQVFGNYYGTSFRELRKLVHEGKKVVLEIDVQGWEKAKSTLIATKSIFIVPPSLEVLRTRLTGRGTDSIEAQQRRLRTAKMELMKSYLYDYFIINDDLEQAYVQLEAIIHHGQFAGISKQNGIRHCEGLIKEFELSSWDLGDLPENIQRDKKETG